MSRHIRTGTWAILGSIAVSLAVTGGNDEPRSSLDRSANSPKAEQPKDKAADSITTDEKSDPAKNQATAAKKPVKFPKLVKSDRFWRSKLNSIQYYVTRRKGTEQAFTGQFWDHHEDGIYTCVGCGTPLFDSETKFDSGTGWPSYWQTVSKNYLKKKPDFSNGMLRTEVNCQVCDAHLGHVFDDGPRPTGLRYCINSASLDFVPREELKEYVGKWRDAMRLPPLEPAPGADPKKSENQADSAVKPAQKEAADSGKGSEPRKAAVDPGR